MNIKEDVWVRNDGRYFSIIINSHEAYKIFSIFKKGNKRFELKRIIPRINKRGKYWGKATADINSDILKSNGYTKLK